MAEDDTKTGTEPEGDGVEPGSAGDDAGGKDSDGAKPAAPPAPAPAKPAVEPISRSEYNALAAQLRQATKEAADRKKQLDDLQVANATEAEKALIKAQQEAADASEKEWRPAVVEARAEAALASAGCTDPEKQALMLRLIDQSTVELDARRRVIGGLAEQVAMIKEKFPDAFTVARAPRVPSAREVDAGDKKPPAVKKSASQIAADRLTGGTR